MTPYSGRAADLPDKSILASSTVAYLKQIHQWHGTNGGRHPDAEMDEAIGRRQIEVLRVGDGR